MKKLLSLLAGIVVFVSASLPAFAFADMQMGDTYYDSVMYLYDSGVVEGYDDGTFGDDENINRAEFLKIVLEANMVGHGGYGEMMMYENSSCFDDVDPGLWYTQYICYAKAEGYIEGYSDGTYKPAQEVNFVEGLKIVLEVTDVSYSKKVDPWYLDIVDTASEMNIIPLTIMAFDQLLTRGEMADMMARQMHYEDGTLADFLGNLYYAPVTYESIYYHTDMYAIWGQGSCLVDGTLYWDGEVIMPDVCSVCFCSHGELQDCTGMCGTEGEGEGEGEGIHIIEPAYYFYTDENGNYYEMTTDVEQNLPLADKANFQALFEGGITQIVMNQAVYYNERLYFITASQGGDPAVQNSLIEYDYDNDVVTVLYWEESVGDEASMWVGYQLYLLGLDLDSDVAVVEWQPYEYLPPICWSPWVDDFDLYVADLFGQGEYLVEYTAPQLVTDEYQDMVDQCESGL